MSINETQLNQFPELMSKIEFAYCQLDIINQNMHCKDSSHTRLHILTNVMDSVSNIKILAIKYFANIDDSYKKESILVCQMALEMAFRYLFYLGTLNLTREVHGKEIPQIMCMLQSLKNFLRKQIGLAQSSTSSSCSEIESLKSLTSELTQKTEEFDQENQELAFYRNWYFDGI